jgi:hypothetical protein
MASLVTKVVRKYTRDPQLAALKKLPWVEKVRKGKTTGARRGWDWEPVMEPAYIITTKPGALTTRVTRKVLVHPTYGPLPGEKLKKPIKVVMPQYTIALHRYMHYCEITLANPMEFKYGPVIPFPTHEDFKIGQWDRPAPVCPGEYSKYYDYSQNYAVKAGVIAELLQAGRSHHAPYRSRAVYAYLLDLLPAEHIVTNAKEYPNDYEND